MLPNHRIKKLLIANRGEIALRIQRTCKKLRLPTVTTVSEADSDAYFAKHSQDVAPLKGSTARDSYLNIEAILRAAEKTGCNAIHPGYGFLSENADFAKAILKAGLIFVGPRPECIELLGNKLEARKLAHKAGVPTTPGSELGKLSDDELAAQASLAGYPVIIKAALGGGGRGMRIARNEIELRSELPLARAESLKSFADERVYVEKYIDRPRHIEVQIFGDNFGNLIHLGTRECSVQRRHQKLIEEAPAPNLSDKLRKRIQDAAVAVGQTIKYNNAGTAEFLVSGDEFYFLEMNTRIQVEHPVTEAVTGLDLIELQLRVAESKRLAVAQSKVRFKGHAIEFRVYTEDPMHNFRPSIGTLGKIEHPCLPFLREDYGLDSGDKISPHYDAMISKLIVSGPTRTEAIERSREVFSKYKVEGLPTTAPFHRWMIEQKPFIASTLDIGYLDRDYSEESRREIQHLSMRDESHKPGRIDRKKYSSKKFNHDYEVEIEHRADGTFVLTPFSAKKSAKDEKFMRRSNILSVALKSLVEEVLEKHPPKTIIS